MACAHMSEELRRALARHVAKHGAIGKADLDSAAVIGVIRSRHEAQWGADLQPPGCNHRACLIVAGAADRDE